MYWSESLYVGKTCRRSVDKLKARIEERAMHTSVYLIVKSEAEGGLLEIIPSIQLLQPDYPTEHMYVIGMAGTKVECDHLLLRIVEDLYHKGWKMA